MTSYDYEYGTSPRKLEPEVRPPKKSPKKATNKNKTTKNSKKIKTVKKTKAQQEKVKNKEVKLARRNFLIIMVIGLGSCLLLMYRSVKIREYYAGVQTLNKEISSLEKENGQISVQIQNNFNLNNIEEIAATTLGMQKLSSSQTVYVNLDTKDYTEISQKSIIKEEKTSLFKKIIDKIVDFF